MLVVHCFSFRRQRQATGKYTARVEQEEALVGSVLRDGAGGRSGSSQDLPDVGDGESRDLCAALCQRQQEVGQARRSRRVLTSARLLLIHANLSLSLSLSSYIIEIIQVAFALSIYLSLFSLIPTLTRH